MRKASFILSFCTFASFACVVAQDRGLPDTTYGIDVSHHQGRIDWSAVRGAGVRFAFIRVSDGARRDRQFDRNWRLSRTHRIIRGAYQYFRPRSDAAAQADLFVDAIGRQRADDFPAVLDVETRSGLPARTVVRRVRQWIERYRARTGQDTVIVYTRASFWTEIGSPRMPGTHLWIAHYTDLDRPAMPTRWPAWTFWQYSDHGRVAGISGNVDLNLYHGDAIAMTAFARRL